MDLAPYRNLPTVSDFRACADLSNYRAVPADWWVLITDVRGSTKAIEAGRYREVNQVGAMGVAALKNAFGGLDFPFVFGGDGATFVLPPAKAAQALPILQGVKAIALSQFGMELRVGALPLSSINGAPPLLCARYEITSGLCTPLFAGGALAAAEAQIKGDAQFCHPAGDPARVDLQGFSCRWEPIPSGRGVTLSLLVQAEDAESYRKVIRLVETYCPLQESPAAPERMRFGAPSKNLRTDQRLVAYAPAPTRIRRYFDLALFTATLRWGLGGQALVAGIRLSNSTHSDHKKFDECLRMVVDCSPEARAAIEQGLDVMMAAGELSYGVQASTHALMTCLVDHLGQGGHVHFIDGGDGGYALAAKLLKARRKAPLPEG